MVLTFDLVVASRQSFNLSRAAEKDFMAFIDIPKKDVSGWSIHSIISLVKSGLLKTSVS